MRGRVERERGWVDGFLFVGNQTALDLLNTKLVKDGEPLELLPDSMALERWLIAADILPDKEAQALARRWRGSREVGRFLSELLAFRERLRAAVLRLEAGKTVPAEIIAELNRHLLQHPVRHALSLKGRRVERGVVLEPRSPQELWAPIAAVAAELLADVEPSRVRKCDSCVAHFLDVSKKGSRRWCSMNLCGNKLKVAAYQRRQRAVARRP